MVNQRAATLVVPLRTSALDPDCHVFMDGSHPAVGPDSTLLAPASFAIPKPEMKIGSPSKGLESWGFPLFTRPLIGELMFKHPNERIWVSPKIWTPWYCCNPIGSRRAVLEDRHPVGNTPKYPPNKGPLAGEHPFPNNPPIGNTHNVQMGEPCQTRSMFLAHIWGTQKSHMIRSYVISILPQNTKSIWRRPKILGAPDLGSSCASRFKMWRACSPQTS